MRWLVVFMCCVYVSACGSGTEDFDPNPPVPPVTGETEVGGARVAVHLPVPAGKSLVCTQGAGGAFSHTGLSTAHDLDFDTSNTTDEELFAPVSGWVRVHASRPGINFGIHLNIDLGDGTYIVLGHLKRVFVQDGQFVNVGQLVAVEGCTGLCTGDHVHMGLHLGDAGRPAEYGTSAPLNYIVVGSGGARVILGNQVRCSTGNGERLLSVLPTFTLPEEEPEIISSPHPSPPTEERETPPPSIRRALALRWDAPNGVSPVRITLSGEYRLADGSYRLWWHQLVEARGGPYVLWSLDDVRSGDTLRFSVEFAQGNGAVSWSCLGPYPEHPTVQGTASVSVDGASVPVRVAGDPASSGCGLAVTVP